MAWPLTVVRQHPFLRHPRLPVEITARAQTRPCGFMASCSGWLRISPTTFSGYATLQPVKSCSVRTSPGKPLWPEARGKDLLTQPQQLGVGDTCHGPQASRNTTRFQVTWRFSRKSRRRSPKTLIKRRVGIIRVLKRSTRRRTGARLVGLKTGGVRIGRRSQQGSVVGTHRSVQTVRFFPR